MVITEESQDRRRRRGRPARCPAPTRSGSTPADICSAARPPKETEEYYHYLVREKGDWEAAEQIIAKRAAGNSQSLSPELMRKMMERVISGGATFPVIGSYDEVAEKFLRLSQAGLDGMAIDPCQLRQRNAGRCATRCCRGWSG